jgi:hypothetical protein
MIQHMSFEQQFLLNGRRQVVTLPYDYGVMRDEDANEGQPERLERRRVAVVSLVAFWWNG